MSNWKVSMVKKCIRPVKINLSSAAAKWLSELFQCALVYELHYSHVYGFILKLRSPSHWKPLYLFRTFSARRKKSFIISRITPSTHTHTNANALHIQYTFCLLLFSEWAIHLAECLFTLPLALESPLFMGSSKPITERNMVGTFYCVTCLPERVNVLFKAKNEQRL